MLRIYLPASVIVSGATVLAVELLGTRVIGPWYGVGLYLWSALIGVTLAALSAGYALGGRWADRGPDLDRYSLLFLLAGVWISLVPWLRDPVLAASEPLGLRGGVLAAATVLFFPPLVLLGMVSPYAIRLKASSLDEVGRTAGNLYALSTLASVVAAIATGFWLIPNLGVARLLAVLGGLLVATGLWGRLAGRGRATAAAGVLLLPLLAGGAGVLTPGETPAPERGLLAIEQSAYAEIRVLEHKGQRYMLIDGAPHTIVDPVDWRSDYPYVDVLEIGKHLLPEPGRMLLVGLGGGSVAKNYAADGWRVDAVEIDPVVTAMAHRFFGLTIDEATVHEEDGRSFLNRQAPASYDLIVLDAFGSSSIPFHLVTKEVFGLIRSRLAPDGLLAVNVEAVGWHDPLVHAVAATLGQVFAEVSVLPIAEPPNTLGNLIVLAADTSLDLAEDLAAPTSRWSRQYNLIHAWQNRFEVDDPSARILTDDLNPVDVWSDRVNVVARNQLHTFFGRSGLDR